MAEKRMFSKTIIDSDPFLDMSLSTQALYFHLSMRADDDGFINNPKKILRMIGANDDELKVLIAKKFVIAFESGVIVIKHWKLHNYIQSDRYKPTVYIEEMSQLNVKENKAYTMDTECIQDVYNMEPQYRLDKIKVDKVSKDSKPTKTKYAEFVSMTEDEYNKLVEQFGEQGTKDRIENLNLYKGSTGKKYASDYLTILSWDRKNKDKPAPQQPYKQKQQPGDSSKRQYDAKELEDLLLGRK